MEKGFKKDDTCDRAEKIAKEYIKGLKRGLRLMVVWFDEYHKQAPIADWRKLMWRQFSRVRSWSEKWKWEWIKFPAWPNALVVPDAKDVDDSEIPFFDEERMKVLQDLIDRLKEIIEPERLSRRRVNRIINIIEQELNAWKNLRGEF